MRVIKQKLSGDKEEVVGNLWENMDFDVSEIEMDIKNIDTAFNMENLQHNVDGNETENNEQNKESKEENIEILDIKKRVGVEINVTKAELMPVMVETINNLIKKEIGSHRKTIRVSHIQDILLKLVDIMYDEINKKIHITPFEEIIKNTRKK